MRTRPYILLLSTNTGYGSGKTTVAKAMREMDSNLETISFATPLKEMVKCLFLSMGATEAEATALLYDDDLKNRPIPQLGDGTITPRRLLQTLGTEWRNMVDPDLWVNIALQKACTLVEEGKNICIDDVRFPHEITCFQKGYFTGHEVIHLNIDRPGNSKGLGQHASEAGLAGVTPDFQMFNDGTIEELKFKVKDLFFPDLHR